MSQSGKAPRPDISDLDEVDESEWVLRRIPKDGFDATQPEGSRLSNALVPSDAFLPAEDSYGLSMYVESMLPDGLASLGKADPKWLTFGVVRVRVGDLRRFDVRVCFSPHDCDYEDETLRNAHASVIGLDKPKRARLVRFLDGHIAKLPDE